MSLSGFWSRLSFGHVFGRLFSAGQAAKSQPTLSVLNPSTLVGFGGEVEVFGHPRDDRVGDRGEASCLLGLLFGVVVGDLFRRENPPPPRPANG